MEKLEQLEQFRELMEKHNFTAVMSPINYKTLKGQGFIHDDKFMGFQIKLDKEALDGTVCFMDLRVVRELNGLEGADGQSQT